MLEHELLSTHSPEASSYPQPLESTNNTIWNLVSTGTLASINDSQFDHAIATSSAALEDLRCNTVRMLQLRASVWAKKANTAEELRDALLIIQIAPDNPTGYLLAGKLYTMQGYQDTAMETFKKGLDNVPTSDPNYTALKRGYDIAETRSQRRINFMTKCSYDIVSHISDFFTRDTVVEAVKVSRQWRNTILEDTWWESFEVRVTKTDTDRLYCLLPTVSHHVKELSVLAGEKLVRKCFKLMQENQFQKLHSLKVFHTADYHSRKLLYKDIGGALSSIATTLTHLRLTSFSFGQLTLADILKTCRSLTNLSLSGFISNTTWLSGLPLTQNTLLTYLTLHTFPKELNLANIEPLLRCSPALELLHLSPSTFDMIPAIKQYCQNLEYLCLDATGELSNVEPEAPDLQSGNLQHLHLVGPLTADTIPSLVQAHHDTLTTLSLIPTNKLAMEHKWHLLLDYSFPMLTTLYVQSDGSKIGNILASLIRRCQNITDITIKGFKDMPLDSVLNALSQLSNLERLCIFDSNVSGNSLPSLLRRLSLKDLQIDVKEGVTEELLKAIATIESLEYLWLSINNCISDTALVEDLTQALGRFPSLESTHLDFMPLSKIAVQNLCSSKSLTLVGFRGGTFSEEWLGMFQRHQIDVDLEQ